MRQKIYLFVFLLLTAAISVWLIFNPFKDGFVPLKIQQSNIILYQGKEYVLDEFPMRQYVESHIPVYWQYFDKGHKDMSDGYDAGWEVRDGRLFLTKLDGTRNGKKVKVSDLFPGQTVYPVEATWYTGPLTINIGKLEFNSLIDVNRKLSADVLVLKVKNGSIYDSQSLTRPLGYKKPRSSPIFQILKILVVYVLPLVAFIFYMKSRVVKKVEPTLPVTGKKLLNRTKILSLALIALHIFVLFGIVCYSISFSSFKFGIKNPLFDSIADLSGCSYPTSSYQTIALGLVLPLSFLYIVYAIRLYLFDDWALFIIIPVMVTMLMQVEHLLPFLGYTPRPHTFHSGLSIWPYSLFDPVYFLLNVIMFFHLFDKMVRRKMS